MQQPFREEEADSEFFEFGGRAEQRDKRFVVQDQPDGKFSCDLVHGAVNGIAGDFKYECIDFRFHGRNIP
jgi:hypothetical protein